MYIGTFPIATHTYTHSYTLNKISIGGSSPSMLMQTNGNAAGSFVPLRCEMCQKMLKPNTLCTCTIRAFSCSCLGVSVCVRVTMWHHQRHHRQHQ